MPQGGPGDSAARLKYDAEMTDAETRPPSPSSKPRRVLSFEHHGQRAEHTARARRDSYAVQMQAQAQVTQQLFIRLREMIQRCRRAHFAVCPASLALLQSIWFHPMTTGLLQSEDGFISTKLRMVGLMTSIAWYNPLTQRVVLLYNDDILAHGDQDPGAIRGLTYSLLPLAAAAEMEQHRYIQRPLMRRRSGLLVRHVPAWGALYNGGRGHPMLLGHYPAEVLDAHLAEAYQQYAGPLLQAERRTLPQLTIWREAGRPHPAVG